MFITRAITSMFYWRIPLYIIQTDNIDDRAELLCHREQITNGKRNIRRCGIEKSMQEEGNTTGIIEKITKCQNKPWWSYETTA